VREREKRGRPGEVPAERLLVASSWAAQPSQTAGQVQPNMGRSMEDLNSIGGLGHSQPAENQPASRYSDSQPAIRTRPLS